MINFKSSDYFYINALTKPIQVCGVIFDKDLNEYIRIPWEKLSTMREGLQTKGRHTSGGCVRFKSNSSKIMIKVKLGVCEFHPDMPFSAYGGCDVYQMQRGGEQKYVASVFPLDDIHEYSMEIPGSTEMIDWTINLPLYSSVKSIHMGILPKSVVWQPTPYQVDLPVVFYGSSITQGGCASRPGNNYTTHLSRWLNFEQINLGFSGNARGDEDMAQYIADIDMKAFVLDFDHNMKSEHELEQVHNSFYKTVRKKNKNLPIIMMSRPDFWNNIELSIKTREVIRKTYINALNNGENVYFIDGETLFTIEEDPLACTVDMCHPNDLGFYRMAKRVYRVLKNIV